MLHLQRFDWDWDANSRIKVGPQSPSPAPFHPRRAPLRSHQTHARTRPSPQVCDRLAFPPALPAALLAELLASGRPAGRGAAPPADPAPYDLQAVLVRSSRGGPDVSPEAGPTFLPRRAPQPAQVHVGAAAAGHYFAYVRHGGAWAEFNDDVVRPCRPHGTKPHDASRSRHEASRSPESPSRLPPRARASRATRDAP